MEITPIEFSTERVEIGKALLKAQAKIQPLHKTETNPVYGSKYADLSAVIESIKAALQEAGVVLLQGGAVSEVNGIQKLSVETILLHAESAQWARNVLSLVPVPDVIARSRDGAQPITAVTPQTIGKTLTYARRYALQALMCIAPEDDDDANAASGAAREKTVRDYKLQESPGGIAEQGGGLTEISGKLTNWREKRYPPDNKNPEGAVIYFGNINMWTIWTKEQELVNGLASAQGKLIEVTGKRSKNRENMFEVISWSPGEELT